MTFFFGLFLGALGGFAGGLTAAYAVYLRMPDDPWRDFQGMDGDD